MVKKQAKYFGIAGNKDKRGITTQRVSINFCNVESLIKATKHKMWMRGLKIGDFSKATEALHLGSLSGNRFSLALRFIDSEDSVITENALRVKEKGFINYFGLQRFGAFHIKTHEIGMEVIRENWEEAMTKVLLSAANESDQRRKVKMVELLKDDKISLAFNLLQNRDRLERVILQALDTNKNGYFNAFTMISRNTRIIYVHAYQSYIWNKAVSHRIKKHGLKVLPGDLIPDTTTEQAADEKLIKVRVLTAEEAEKESIYNIVFPIIGKSTQLPENEYAEIISKFMEEDNIIFEMFKSKNMEAGCAHGAYRKLLAKPGDFEFDTVTHAERDVDLLNPHYLIPGETEVTPTPGEFKTLRLKFTLPSSSYATMCVREVLKSSSDFQEQLEKSKA